MSWTTLARIQHGLIARRQFAAAKVGRTSVDHMVRSGRLELTDCRGVYRVAGAPFTPESASWLAVLCAGAPLSYLSAAVVWEQEAPDDGYVHITTLQRRKVAWPRGVRVHRVGLAESAVTERHGLSVTTRLETTLDCMAWLPLSQARRFADRAVQQGWVAPDDVTRRLVSQSGRWGNGQLRRLLPQLGDGAAAESERVAHRLLRAHGIEGWVPNLTILLGGARYEIDIAFPGQRIAVEIDGFDYHRRDRFQRDRTRQNALIAAGWTVLRFTWSDLEDRPSYVIDTIARLLVA